MILSTIEPVIPLLRHVRIDEAKVLDLARRLASEDLTLPAWRGPVFPEADDETAAAIFCTANVINFSFWGEPKWTVIYRGGAYDGTFGLFAALRRAVEEGRAVTDGAYLRDLTADDLAHVLRGSVVIPMFEARLALLREAGRALCERGSWLALLQAADGSAVRLVARLTTDFPSFNDAARLDGHTVRFHKRAQLLPAMLCGRFGGQSYGTFGDIGALTIFADYKLPQMLRRFGALAYDGDLARRVDACEEIPSASREEVEIRAATVWACELIRRACDQIVEGVTAPQIDAALWHLGQQKTPDERPYHRTRTIYY